jgi:hypothetical protein
MKVLCTTLVAVMLVGCEAETTAPPADSELLFKDESKPVGDPGAETYREEVVPAVEIEVRPESVPPTER